MAPGIRKPFHQLGAAVVLDRLYFQHRDLSVCSPNCGRQPFEFLPITRTVWKEVARVSERQGTVTLQFSPYRDTQARTFSGQTEHEQQVRGHKRRLSWGYSHSICVIHLTHRRDKAIAGEAAGAAR